MLMLIRDYTIGYDGRLRFRRNLDIHLLMTAYSTVVHVYQQETPIRYLTSFADRRSGKHNQFVLRLCHARRSCKLSCQMEHHRQVTSDEGSETLVVCITHLEPEDDVTDCGELFKHCTT